MRGTRRPSEAKRRTRGGWCPTEPPPLGMKGLPNTAAHSGSSSKVMKRCEWWGRMVQGAVRGGEALRVVGRMAQGAPRCRCFGVGSRFREVNVRVAPQSRSAPIEPAKRCGAVSSSYAPGAASAAASRRGTARPYGGGLGGAGRGLDTNCSADTGQIKSDPFSIFIALQQDPPAPARVRAR